MNNKKLVAIALIVVGVLALLAGLLADTLGFGGTPGYGYKQIIAMVVGVVLVIAGFVAMNRK